MKKILTIIMILGFLSIPLSYAEQFPAPFQRAKELALKMPINQNGDRIWMASVNDDGQFIEYGIIYGYHKRGHETILLVKKVGIGGKIIGYCNMCKIYRLWESPFPFFIDVDEKTGQETAFQFFRELVYHNLI